MIGRLKCVRNGVKIFGRLSARVWSAVFKKMRQRRKQNLWTDRREGAGGQRSFLKNVSAMDVTNLTHEFVTHYGEF